MALLVALFAFLAHYQFAVYCVETETRFYKFAERGRAAPHFRKTANSTVSQEP
jgi:hypothetical protein